VLLPGDVGLDPVGASRPNRWARRSQTRNATMACRADPALARGHIARQIMSNRSASKVSSSAALSSGSARKARVTILAAICRVTPSRSPISR